ncbi:hypothetical protein ACFPOE_21860 [Caenimonas terrae]|uniref:Uncharacterized protein n=1 Tax=Caenimonas terrae TaxID=696074 RepID=A0ABW0NII6_9BURK
MACNNQRSIYEGISKVVGSSNRGFITLDPERQCRIATQPAKALPGAGAMGEPRAPQARPGTLASASGLRR